MAVRKELTTINGNKELRKPLPIMKKDVLLEKIKMIDCHDPFKKQQRQAFACFLFLTACRVSEVCKQMKYCKGEKPIMIGEPIKRSDISFGEDPDFIDIDNVRTLKKRKPENKTVVIDFRNNPEMYTIFKDYVSQLGVNAYLFPFTRQMAYKFLSKVGLFNHYLRHLRLTNLVTEHHFDSLYLKKFVNWTSSKTADSYVHLDTRDIRDKMRR